MTDLAQIATRLQRREDGIWVSPVTASLSYPEAGNQRCLAIESAGSFWFEHRNACILEALQTHPPAGSLFDVGGGNGVVALAIQESGIDTVLLEPGADGATNARARGVHTVACSTLEDAGIEPGTLPAVGLFDVLEHIEDDRGFLRELAQRLVPEGQIYLTVPAYTWLWSGEDEYAGHHRRYTQSGTARLLESAGFEVLYQTCFFLSLPLPILLLRTLPSLLGFRGAEAREQEAREHRAPGGPIGWALTRVQAFELWAIRRGTRLPVGGSILAVARRRP
ncbi:MAG: class I SAM-dependent methyltransferase [bacterium]|nr:class I SAM-dependent methyltransferase [bacterium]MCP5071071.1 class I SAM-dependent methyltransferase [bacterium]